MRTVFISKDEYYPVYDIQDSNGSKYDPQVEISDELYQRYLAAHEEFENVQKELSQLYIPAYQRLVDQRRNEENAFKQSVHQGRNAAKVLREMGE